MQESLQDVVITSKGAVRGVVERGVTIFRGIPFAAPPIGELRFEPPAPVTPWNGIRDCRAFGPMAMQNFSPPLIGVEPFFAPGVLQSEDCLNLNVWTPAVEGESRAVLVYFHGGGFRAGSGTAPWFEGSVLASSESIVVVTVNYRLGLFGTFVVSDDLTSSNNLLRDQVAALEWVQENIGSFGGNPSRVTIAGESAGAMSAVALLAVPAAAGKFHAIIVESGHGSFIPPVEFTREVHRRTLMELELSESPDVRGALRSIAASRVLAAQENIVAKLLMPTRPQIDGSYLPLPILETVAASQGPPVPMLIGNDAEEARAFSDKNAAIDFVALVEELTGADRRDDAVAEIIDMYWDIGTTDGDSWDALRTDLDWLRPSRRLIQAHVSAGSPVYQFEFAWGTPAFGLGAAHAVIVPFPFGNVRNLGHTEMFGSEPDGHVRGSELSEIMVRAWGSFIREGKPTCSELPAWPMIDLGRPLKMRLDDESAVVLDDFVHRDEIWAKNFPDVPSQHDT